MELKHHFTVPAGADAAWTTFMDLERVGGCFPGATVTEANDAGFAGTVKVKLGPIALVYGGTGSFIERDDAAHRAVIEAKGKDKRGNGTAAATVTIQLTAETDAQTAVEVTTDLAVTGKPAQFGRGVMQDVSDKLLGQFVACIESQFAAAPAVESTSDAAGSDAAGSDAAGSDAAGSDAARDARPAAATDEGPVPTPAPAAASTPAAAPSRVAAPAASDSLDLGSAVLPVLLKSYAPHAVALLVGVLIGWLIGRR